VLDMVTPDEFRERTSAGKRKQFSPKHDLDRDLLARIRAEHHLERASLVHPSAMFRLFMGLWRNRATIDLVDAYTAFRPLAPLPAQTGDDGRHGLPAGYVAAKFYFSRAFPDKAENRAFVNGVLKRISAKVPVALLSTAVRLDDHHDFHTSGSGIYVVDAHGVPGKNLERQTQVIGGARGFIGTYGGFSYLAPFYGVRSLSFFSRRYGFKNHHLELADRVFDRLLPGGFVALHRAAGDLVEPAVERWTQPIAREQSAAEEPLTEAEADALT